MFSFDAIDREWLVRFVDHRVADRRVVRLIQKWLNAGVLEAGARTRSEERTPQGGYADDFVVGFESKSDAETFLSELRERFAKFGLELHADKTRLIEFGRFAAANASRGGRGKTATFDFLGFTHISGKTRRGWFTVKRQTMRKRLQAKLHEVKANLKRRMHHPIPEVAEWLDSVIRGHVQYYGVPQNLRALRRFRSEVIRLWRQVLAQRSQRGRVTWARMRRLATRYLAPVRICHPYPSQRLVVMTQGRSPVR